jgi:DNA ligase-associated metallophosphoesterase
LSTLDREPVTTRARPGDAARPGRAAIGTSIEGAARVDVGGERLTLLPQRAAWHAASRTLLVADVHLGKAASFRALGVPVPAGTTATTLRRLGALVDALDAARLVVLGDLLHGPAVRQSDALAALSRWRAERRSLRVVLVRGNHDDRAGDPPAHCGIETVDGPLPLGALRLSHSPDEAADGHVVAGHLHPAFRLSGRVDSLRLPCFWLRERSTVLPAFGEFTGALTIAPEGGDRVFVTDGRAVFRVPAGAVRA